MIFQESISNLPEMEILFIIVACLGAYMLGSIPTAVWTGKLFHGIDVREHGSGNAGATNVIRVLGWKTGTPVLLIDLAKGWAAAMLPVFFRLAPEDSALLTNLQILTGMMSIVGHVFPLFAVRREFSVRSGAQKVNCYR